MARQSTLWLRRMGKLVAQDSGAQMVAYRATAQVVRQSRLRLGQRYRFLQRPADLAQAHAAPGRAPVKRLPNETPRRLVQAGGGSPPKIDPNGRASWPPFALSCPWPYRVPSPPFLGMGLLSVCTGILPRAEGPLRHKEPPQKYAGYLENSSFPSPCNDLANSDCGFLGKVLVRALLFI